MNKKQNTAVICLSLVNGGMELAAVKLARLLSQDQHISFFARKDGFIEKDSADHFKDYDIDLNIIEFKSYFSYALISQVRTLLKNKNIKNVIFLGASEMRSLHFATLGLDINFIIRQGSKKTSPKKDFFHKIFYSNVNTFVGNSEYIKQNIQDILPLAKDAKLTRIYASLKLPQNIVQHPLNETINIISVGRVHPGKAQFKTIQACESLHENNIAFKLDFLGDIQDKEYYKEIQTYLETSRIKDQVTFVGYTKEIPKYFQNSDIFMLPSLGEGMSNAIIESLGYGLIPIIFNDTSAPEFSQLGFHLHLTENNTIDNLSTTLVNVSRNIEYEKKKAQMNITVAKEVFSLKRERNEYTALLK